MSRKYFFDFSSPDPRVSLLCPSMSANGPKTRLLSHRILKSTGHKRTWADKHDETFLQMIKDSRIPLCFAIPEDRPALCKTSPCESANVRPSPPLSVQVRQCPSKSANVRPSPPMSVYVRQCPKKHVRCLIESKKDRT